MNRVSSAAMKQPQKGRKANRSRSAQRRPLNPYPVDTSAELIRLIGTYRDSALQVSFREMVPWIKVGERATHYLHSYPAKLLPQIAHFFLAASILSKQGDTVLDPFGGTGTVALEALLSGRHAINADANPLARLIAQVKTRVLSDEELLNAFEGVKTRYKLARAGKPPSVVNLEYWYSAADIRALCRLRSAVLGERHKPLRDFLLVTFSSVCRRVSNADPRFSVPVRRKDSDTVDVGAPSLVWNQFENQFFANAERFCSLRQMGFKSRARHCVGEDARDLRVASDWDDLGKKRLPDSSVDLIITSPPYAGAQKYIRASSLSLGWLGLAGSRELRGFERKNIGREHLDLGEVQRIEKSGLEQADALISAISRENPSRAAIVATYLLEMKLALKESVRALRPGGYFVLVIGDNQVCGREFASSLYLTQILNDLGLQTKLRLVDEIRSRGLITKRNKTAGMISKEWIILLQKSVESR